MALIWQVLALAALLPGCVHGSAVWERMGPPGFIAKATLSADAGEIPDQVTLRLELISPDAYQPDLDAVRANLLRYGGLSQPFHLIVEKTVDAHTIEYTLEPQLPGIFPLTFYSIPFKAKDGKDPAVEIISGIFEYTASLPKTEVDFLSYMAPLLPVETPLPLSASGELRRGLMRATPEQIEQQSMDIESRAFPWLGVAGVFIFAAVILAIKLAPKPAIVIKRASNQYEQAFGLATQLLNQGTAGESRESAKAYFTALTETVRYYIEDTYAMVASAQTSEEFLQTVNTNNLLEGATAAQVEAFLRICDAVKFGDYRPSAEESALAYATVKELISSDTGKTTPTQ